MAKTQQNLPPSLVCGDGTEMRLVPPEYTRGIVRWAHPDGYFLNAKGQKATDNYSPTLKHGIKPYTHGVKYPYLRECANTCHLLMALAFYGPRPGTSSRQTGGVASAEKGNNKRTEYFCHHLIPDPLDYKPANLLCWLTREQHTEADRRQRALRKCVPDLHAFTYERLRELQDPRTMSREEFEKQLAEVNQRQRALRKHVPDLHAFTNKRLRELQDPRTMPREEFERQLTLIPVFTIDPDCDRREPNKHYDPFCERDDPPHGMLNFGVPDANQQSVCSGESVAQNIGVIERCYRESRGVLV